MYIYMCVLWYMFDGLVGGYELLYRPLQSSVLSFQEVETLFEMTGARSGLCVNGGGESYVCCVASCL